MALLQLFLSPRAVSILVCNTKDFGHRASNLDDREQLTQDYRVLKKLRVYEWLTSLSCRIPDSDFIVVATKCDLAGGLAADMAGRIESAIRKWLSARSETGATPVRMEDGVSLTSCITPALEGRKNPSSVASGRDSSWPCDWSDDMRDAPPPSLL